MKRLVLFRGLPGSGKSTLAAALIQHIVAADDFMTDEAGNYRFDPAQLPTVHGKCRRQVETWMQADIQLIGVHNTFSKLWEMEPYLELGKKYGYAVHVVHVERHHDGTNTHGVPEDRIQAMAGRWESVDKDLLRKR